MEHQQNTEQESGCKTLCPWFDNYLNIIYGSFANLLNSPIVFPLNRESIDKSLQDLYGEYNKYKRKTENYYYLGYRIGQLEFLRDDVFKFLESPSLCHDYKLSEDNMYILDSFQKLHKDSSHIKQIRLEETINRVFNNHFHITQDSTVPYCDFDEIDSEIKSLDNSYKCDSNLKKVLEKVYSVFNQYYKENILPLLNEPQSHSLSHFSDKTKKQISILSQVRANKELDLKCKQFYGTLKGLRPYERHPEIKYVERLFDNLPEIKQEIEKELKQNEQTKKDKSIPRIDLSKFSKLSDKAPSFKFTLKELESFGITVVDGTQMPEIKNGKCYYSLDQTSFPEQYPAEYAKVQAYLKDENLGKVPMKDLIERAKMEVKAEKVRGMVMHGPEQGQGKGKGIK